MVYRGKPSGGCDNCRKLHVKAGKCDEAAPDCSRCLNMKRKCSGYRDHLDLMFHDETAATRERAHGSSTSSGRKSRSPMVRSDSNSDSTYSIGTSLCASVDDFAIYHFYHTTEKNLRTDDNAHYLHTQLPGLYNNGDLESAIRLATQAISYAFLTKFGYNKPQISRARYLQAIKAIQKAIQNPAKAKCDQTLYAIFLLCGYETIMFDSETISAWGTHIDGAAALMKMRGYELLSSALSRSLFLFLRKNLVISHVQTSQPIDAIFTELDMTTYSLENVEDQLICRASRIPELQQQAKGLLSHPFSSSMDSFVRQLIDTATSLDCELLDWAHNIPPTWRYHTAINLNPPAPHSDFIPPYLHRYEDFYTARVWNTFRVSRLVIQSILLRAFLWLDGMLAISFPILDMEKIQTIIKESVDGICASVYFLLGHDLSKAKHHAANDVAKGTPRQLSPISGSKYDTLKLSGKFSLIWPLYVGSSAASIPEAQRRWMRTQLRQIAEAGESQAQILLDRESQTLSGGIEAFRFDCV